MISVKSNQSSASVASDAYQLRVVQLGEVDDLEARHPQIHHLLSRDLMAKYARFPGASHESPVFFYLENEGSVCSYFRAIPDEITIDVITRRWAWSGDNFTFPEFRNRGLSTKLHGQATSYLHDRGIGRAGVYSTEVALHVFKKLGFTLLGFAERYLLLRSASPFLAAHIPSAPARSMLNAISTPLAGTAIAGVRLWNRMLQSGTKCAGGDECSADTLQELLPRIAASRSIHFGMDATFLQLKLEIARQTGDMSLWLIQDAKSKDCIAYMVVRERVQKEPLAERYSGFRLMTLMDFGFVVGDTRAAAGIAGHLLNLFLKSDCHVLQIISNNKLVNRSALRRGMRKVGKGMSFTYSAPKDWNLPAHCARLQSWHLTNFCGDAFTW
jgi:GNAT superfamily N-acetyltransferase